MSPTPVALLFVVLGLLVVPVVRVPAWLVKRVEVLVDPVRPVEASLLLLLPTRSGLAREGGLGCSALAAIVSS